MNYIDINGTYKEENGIKTIDIKNNKLLLNDGEVDILSWLTEDRCIFGQNIEIEKNKLKIIDKIYIKI